MRFFISISGTYFCLSFVLLPTIEKLHFDRFFLFLFYPIHFEVQCENNFWHSSDHKHCDYIHTKWFILRGYCGLCAVRSLNYIFGETVKRMGDVQEIFPLARINSCKRKWFICVAWWNFLFLSFLFHYLLPSVSMENISFFFYSPFNDVHSF